MVVNCLDYVEFNLLAIRPPQQRYGLCRNFHLKCDIGAWYLPVHDCSYQDLEVAWQEAKSEPLSTRATRRKRRRLGAVQFRIWTDTALEVFEGSNGSSTSHIVVA